MPKSTHTRYWYPLYFPLLKLTKWCLRTLPGQYILAERSSFRKRYWKQIIHLLYVGFYSSGVVLYCLTQHDEPTCCVSLVWSFPPSSLFCVVVDNSRITCKPNLQTLLLGCSIRWFGGVAVELIKKSVKLILFNNSRYASAKSQVVINVMIMFTLFIIIFSYYICNLECPSTYECSF